MKLKVRVAKPSKIVGDIGVFYISTRDANFVEEVKKYKCPYRLTMYLDLNFEYNPLVEEINETNFIDLEIDLSDKSKEIVHNPEYSPFCEEYLEQTPELDKYGNELSKEEAIIFLCNNEEITHLKLQDGDIISHWFIEDKTKFSNEELINIYTHSNKTDIPDL